MVKILKDKYLRVVVLGMVIVYLICVIFSGVKFYDRIDPIIIHYDIYKGFDLIGDRLDFFGIFFSVVFMSVLNLLLADFIYERERFLSYVLVFSGLIISVIFLIATSIIVSIN